jgi:hypothetical protein
MSSEKRVDVLAVMRHSVSALHGAADDGADTRRHADALHDARAAVAELIEAAEDARSALHLCIDALGSEHQEDYDALSRVAAALANIGPTP